MENFNNGGPCITLFVYNIPQCMHWKGLWMLFEYHGTVVDAFIPVRESRRGKRYGFIRFRYRKDAHRAIARLNGFVLLGSRIWVKLATYKGNRKVWRKVNGREKQSQTTAGQREEEGKLPKVIRKESKVKVASWQGSRIKKSRRGSSARLRG